MPQPNVLLQIILHEVRQEITAFSSQSRSGRRRARSSTHDEGPEQTLCVMSLIFSNHFLEQRFDLYWLILYFTGIISWKSSEEEEPAPADREIFTTFHL